MTEMVACGATSSWRRDGFLPFSGKWRWRDNGVDVGAPFWRDTMDLKAYSIVGKRRDKGRKNIPGRRRVVFRGRFENTVFAGCNGGRLEERVKTCVLVLRYGKLFNGIMAFACISTPY